MGCDCTKEKPPEPVYKDPNVIDLDVPLIWMLGANLPRTVEQIKKLTLKYKLQDASPSTVIKKEMESRSERGKELAQCILLDMPPSNELLMAMFREELSKPMTDANGYYMTHFPLLIKQGLFFEKKVADANLILYFWCTDKALTAYFKTTASVSVLKKAAKANMLAKKKDRFYSHAIPIIKYYGKRCIVINAEGDPEDIYEIASNEIAKLYEGEKGFKPKVPFGEDEVKLKVDVNDSSKEK